MGSQDRLASCAHPPARNVWLLRRESSVDLAIFRDGTAGPEEQAACGVLHRHLRRLIAGLPRKLRDVLLLEQSGDYKYEDIATIVGVPVGTVKWRISEARRRLRAELMKLGYDQRG
jgi:DNA-directed RNA polymerase specialized sigma24 family protein